MPGAVATTDAALATGDLGKARSNTAKLDRAVARPRSPLYFPGTRGAPVIVSSLPRAVSGWSIALLGLVLLAAGCTSAGQSSSADQGPSTDQIRPSLPPGCTHTITRAGDAPATLAAAAPGDTLCFSGGDLADADMTMTRSGTVDAPIRLVADGATVQSLQITADHVVLESFTVASGDGVLLKGTGITARRNTIHDTQQGGITCDACTASTIESNTMTHVATAGIWITGQRITVHANTISDTVPQGHSDADGIRFFGNGHRIGNTTTGGYPTVDIDDSSRPGSRREANNPPSMTTAEHGVGFGSGQTAPHSRGGGAR